MGWLAAGSGGTAGLPPTLGRSLPFAESEHQGAGRAQEPQEAGGPGQSQVAAALSLVPGSKSHSRPLEEARGLGEDLAARRVSHALPAPRGS